jgi:hypothetical protein
MSNATEGWQKPTEGTGYAAPLDVRYRVQEDGTVNAMARPNIDYWTISNSDPGVRVRSRVWWPGLGRVVVGP